MLDLRRAVAIIGQLLERIGKGWVRVLVVVGDCKMGVRLEGREGG